MANPCFQGQGRPVARTDEINESKNFTIPTPRSAGNDPQKFMVGQPKNQIEEMHIDNFLVPSSFSRWRTSFTTEVCSCSGYAFRKQCVGSEEDEVATTVDDFKTSQSTRGHRISYFEMPDCEDRFLLEEGHPKFQLQEKGQSGRAEGSI